MEYHLFLCSLFSPIVKKNFYWHISAKKKKIQNSSYLYITVRIYFVIFFLDLFDMILRYLMSTKQDWVFITVTCVVGCSASVLDRLNALLEPLGELSINERGVIDGEIPSIKPHSQFRWNNAISSGLVVTWYKIVGNKIAKSCECIQKRGIQEKFMKEGIYECNKTALFLCSSGFS